MAQCMNLGMGKEEELLQRGRPRLDETGMDDHGCKRRRGPGVQTGKSGARVPCRRTVASVAVADEAAAMAAKATAASNRRIGCPGGLAMPASIRSRPVYTRATDPGAIDRGVNNCSAEVTGRSATRCTMRARKDRKSVVEGKSVLVRVDLGGRRIIKKKK